MNQVAPGYPARGSEERMVLTEAVKEAQRAPSVHNTQPWRWRIRPGTIDLFADWHRHLVTTDPDRRDLVLSCGAALHHLEVALAARGLEAHIERLPDPEDESHIATVTVQPGTPDPADAELFPAIARRRTDRRRMSHRPVPPAELEALAGHAARKGAELILMTGAMRRRLAQALGEAARRQLRTPGYVSELRMWTRRYAAARDGIPTANIAPPPAGLLEPSPLRQFPGGRLRQPKQPPGRGPADDGAELLVRGRGSALLPSLGAHHRDRALGAVQQRLAHRPEHQPGEAAAAV